MSTHSGLEQLLGWKKYIGAGTYVFGNLIASQLQKHKNENRALGEKRFTSFFVILLDLANFQHFWPNFDINLTISQFLDGCCQLKLLMHFIWCIYFSIYPSMHSKLFMAPLIPPPSPLYHPPPPCNLHLPLPTKRGRRVKQIIGAFLFGFSNFVMKLIWLL